MVCYRVRWQVGQREREILNFQKRKIGGKREKEKRKGKKTTTHTHTEKSKIKY